MDTVNNRAVVQSPSLSTRGHRQQHSHCAESISVYTWTPSTTQPLCRVHLCLHVDTVNNTAIVQSPLLSTRGHRRQHSHCAESTSVCAWHRRQHSHCAESTSVCAWHRQQHSHCAESTSVYTWTSSTTQPLCIIHICLRVTPSTTQPLCIVCLCLHVDTVDNAGNVDNVYMFILYALHLVRSLQSL